MARSTLVAIPDLLYGLVTTFLQKCFKIWKQEKFAGISPDIRVDGAQRISDVLPDNCG